MKYYIVMQGSIIDVAYNIKQAREQAETWSKVWRDWVNVYTKSTLKCAYDDGRYVDMRRSISNGKHRRLTHTRHGSQPAGYLFTRHRSAHKPHRDADGTRTANYTPIFKRLIQRNFKRFR